MLLVETAVSQFVSSGTTKGRANFAGLPEASFLALGFYTRLCLEVSFDLSLAKIWPNIFNFCTKWNLNWSTAVLVPLDSRWYFENVAYLSMVAFLDLLIFSPGFHFITNDNNTSGPPRHPQPCLLPLNFSSQLQIMASFSSLGCISTTQNLRHWLRFSTYCLLLTSPLFKTGFHSFIFSV